LVIFLFTVPIVGDQIQEILKAGRVDPDKIDQLNERVVELEHQLAQARAEKRVYELQRELDREDERKLKNQASGQEVAVIGFCDLVGFTSFLNNHGDKRAKRVLEKFNDMVRSVLEAFSGVEIKQLGDGFLFSFNSSQKAINGAFRLREGLERVNSEEGLKLSLRVGLHAGEVIKENEDLIGSAVNMAERIMKEAGTDQIVVSETFKHLTNTGDSFTFVDLGERDLKGFQGPRRIYELKKQ